MKTKNQARGSADYVRPEIVTLSGKQIVESLGPVSAGSGDCGPMLENFCL